MNTMQKIARENERTDLPEFNVGDLLKIQYRIVDGANSRLQAFSGNVIAIKNYVDGVLTNIPSINTAMTVKFYTDSTKTTEITPDSNTMDNTTAGVYKATVVLDTALSSV